MGNIDVPVLVRAQRLLEAGAFLAGFRLGIEVSRPEFFSEILGVWLAGGVAVPLRETVLAGEATLRQLVEAIGEGRMGADELPCGNPIPGEETWHAIYFTSGSTGEPKAVVRGWRQALHEARCYAELLGLSSRMRCSMLVDPVFGASTKHFLGCLLTGCVQSVGKNATRHGHLLYGTPGQISAFAEEARGCFQWISMTGEACSPRAWKAAMELADKKGCVLNALGGSEFGVAANQVSDARSPMPSSFSGVPLRGKKLEVIDEEGMALRAGETGMLRVVSENLAEGYLVRDAAGLRLEPFPRMAGGRFFSTGDVGWLDEDGCFHHLGRSGKMQKRGARWIDTAPLRQALESCTGVREFVVDWPAGSLRPLVWCGLEEVSPRRLEEVSLRLMQAGLDEHLVPAELRGVRQLPRNRHGKIDLAALAKGTNEEGRAIFKMPDRIPQIAEALCKGDGEAPVFRGAESLVELGLDSLSLHELAAELSNLLQRSIPPAMLMVDLPLSSLIEKLRGKSSHAISVSRSDRGKPLLLWFGDGLASLVNGRTLEFEIVGFDYESAMQDPVWNNATGIPQLAATLLDSQADGIGNRPVFTGGFSFGALLAHEAGVVLQRRDATVAGVFLVDPPSLQARAIRTGWRWSRWRPSIWIGFLSPLRSFGLPSVRWRLAKEIRLRAREWRRRWMRHYQPSKSKIETILFSSVENLSGSLGLFQPACERLSSTPLPVKKHLDVVRDRRSVAEWSTAVCERIDREIRAREPGSV